MRGRLTVSDVRVIQVEGAVPSRSTLFQSQVRPLDRYEEDRLARRRGDEASVPEQPAAATALYLELATKEGPAGLYGPIDEAAAWSVLKQLRPLLLGQDALAGAVAWDRLQRSDRHARHGYLKMGISAVDNALWDLRGKAFDAPVWQLLGGPSRRQVPVYASTLGRPHGPGEVEATALELKQAGFGAQKWFFQYGPEDGPEGLAANVALAARARGALGPGYPLMFDAFSGWDLRSAIEWSDAASAARPSWLEEPLPPGQLAAYEELHRRADVPLAAGEHLYDRFEVLPYLEAGTLTVLQCDPEWCGGVTELVRICALAELFGVPVIPHGHGLHAALHVVASQSPEVCPMGEYLVEVMPRRHYFDREAPGPVGGSLPLPEQPGFGIVLDEDRIQRRRTW